jgi:hypothetical protein
VDYVRSDNFCYDSATLVVNLIFLKSLQEHAPVYKNIDPNQGVMLDYCLNGH